jgi:predicted dehydrogenase
MFDMGPYYVTALVNMLGPVARVTGSTARAHDERVIAKGPRAGQRIRVEVATHVAATLEFRSGAVATLVTSFDIAAGARLPQIQVYGTEGSLDIPTPNGFGKAVSMRRCGDEDWSEVPFTHAHLENSRGMGVADMARALATGRPHRASGELAYHVLDVMQATLDAAESGRRIELESSCERPAAIPPGLPDGVLD